MEPSRFRKPTGVCWEIPRRTTTGASGELFGARTVTYQTIWASNLSAARCLRLAQEHDPLDLTDREVAASSTRMIDAPVVLAIVSTRHRSGACRCFYGVSLQRKAID